MINGRDDIVAKAEKDAGAKLTRKEREYLYDLRTKALELEDHAKKLMELAQAARHEILAIMVKKRLAFSFRLKEDDGIIVRLNPPHCRMRMFSRIPETYLQPNVFAVRELLEDNDLQAGVPGLDIELGGYHVELLQPKRMAEFRRRVRRHQSYRVVWAEAEKTVQQQEDKYK